MGVVLMRENIMKRGMALGASLAGIACAAELQASPSHEEFGWIQWPARGASVLVLALAHPPNEPELDWWGVEGGTFGNRRLQEISLKMNDYLNQDLGEKAYILPYAPGVFLKDAAVLAGIGVMGDNNLVVTPEYGPCIRLRALFLEKKLPPTGLLSFTPCDDCDHACWQACPQDSFAAGRYSQQGCKRQMAMDEKNQVKGMVPYCRACELGCSSVFRKSRKFIDMRAD